MDKHEIIQNIENFAPPQTAEPWDCSGWIVETPRREIQRIMLALTVTNDIVKQSREQSCDMIISHHPLFKVPFDYRETDIYCAHTNMDLAQGGTTDTLIKDLGLRVSYAEGFLRYVEEEIGLEKFVQTLKMISPNLRYTNPNKVNCFKKIAFCAGSGSEFIEEAAQNGADALVTGDLKFHTALDSSIAVFDIGHFESEIGILKVFANLIGHDIEILYAEECSPFII